MVLNRFFKKSRDVVFLFLHLFASQPPPRVGLWRPLQPVKEAPRLDEKELRIESQTSKVAHQHHTQVPIPRPKQLGIQFLASKKLASVFFSSDVMRHPKFFVVGKSVFEDSLSKIKIPAVSLYPFNSENSDQLAPEAIRLFQGPKETLGDDSYHQTGGLNQPTCHDLSAAYTLQCIL